MAGPKGRPDPLTAFKIARRWFQAGRRIEMQDLATEVGVSRATLFRWVGGRDELLTEVMWSLAEPTLRDAVAAAPGEGGTKLAGALESFSETLLATDYFAVFLRREPERALRVLTTRAGSLQGRMTAAMQELLNQHLDPAKLPMEPPDLAYLLVRVVETFLYTDMITGAQANPAKVGQAVAALLRD
ncbi:TetR family transcriptional regulator [Nocardioides luteus]|uniref:TetR family transcriptional regulator n=1 Tax=Nocardioides luteus TaxID=1844 RepID=A0A1J4N921_9ACTN|nr:TetR family transcriptional regulator [Nocardioides luteus]